MREKSEKKSYERSYEKERKKGWEDLKKNVIDKKVEVELWVKRVLKIMLKCGYLINIIGNKYNEY
jgi:hypothetical protein